jgi:hypothetical protein
MEDRFFHADMRSLLLTQRLVEARRDAAAERQARVACRVGRWRSLLSNLLVRLGTLLVAAGEALRRDPASTTGTRR